MDTVDKETRSRIMASVGQKNTGPETSLRVALHRAGLRYRLHDRRLPGTPDLVFPKYRAVIFVHGCYWHSHGCYKSTVPKTRQAFWVKKFKANKERDERKLRQLHELGWRVMVVWECALLGRSAQPISQVTDQVSKYLQGTEMRGDISGDRSTNTNK